MSTKKTKEQENNEKLLKQQQEDLKKRQAALEKFTEELKGKSIADLEDMEEEWVAKADENDKVMNGQEYDMPVDNYKLVATWIRKFLDKQTVQWQYTLGLVGMYDFWDPEKNPGKIPYPQLDAILRMLGDGKYTGYEEWAAIVAINKFFEPLHKAYTETLAITYDIASRHDAIVQELEKRKPIGDLSKKDE